MNQGIVIVSSFRTRIWLNDLLKSIGNWDKQKVVVHYNSEDNNQYEIGGIKRGLLEGFEEFLLLHDTCLIKSKSLFKVIFDDFYGSSVSISPDFLSYLGKYRRETLLKCTIPEVNSKKTAVDEETRFNREYISKEPFYHVLYPEFDINYRFEEKHGRNNMVLESPALIKYKGTWSYDMIKEAE